jgi:peptidylprolyl isomerase
MPFIASLYSCKEEYGDLEDGLYAKLKQTGDIIVALDYTKAPITVANLFL